MLSAIAAVALGAGGAVTLSAGVLAPAALAADATPPSITAAPTEAVGPNTAILAATLTPGSEDALYSFEYGSTEGYGLGTPPLPAGAGSAPIDARFPVADLAVRTTYHYRLIARTESGTTYGPDQTFTTVLAPAPAITATLPATGVSGTEATLNAAVDPSRQPTTVFFEYGETPALGTSSAQRQLDGSESFTGVPITVGGLKPSTAYYFRAVTVNASGPSYGGVLPMLTGALVTKVTAEPSPSRVDFGDSTTITGELTGQGVDGITVALMRQDFPFSKGPVQVAAAQTLTGGGYAFEVGPVSATTKFWVQSRSGTPTSSPLATVYGKLKVSMSASKTSSSRPTLKGTVEPYVAGATATIQRRQGRDKWITVSRPKLTRDGSANRATFTGRATKYSKLMKYRVLVDPKNNGAQYKSASKVIGIPGR